MELIGNEKTKTQWMILALGVFLMGIRFAAFYLTHSNAILTDVLDSIVNLAAGGFGLYSLYFSNVPKDIDHPYGHGKIEYISSSIEGSLIVIAGVLIAVTAIYSLFNPQQIEKLNTGIFLIAISGLLNFLMGYYAAKKGKRRNSLALEASGEHLKSDAYSTVGVLVGLALVYVSGFVWIDNITALSISILIIYSGYKIIERSVGAIMDKADFELNAQVIAYIEAHRKPEWIDVHNFRIIKYGEVIHIDCHMTMPWYYTNQQAHDSMKEFEKCLTNSVSNPVETFIHIDPCIPSSCAICQISDCLYRTHPFERRIKWTQENITTNRKHQ